MLLGEPVNDFDYYFTSKETTLAVAEYYAEEFNKSHPGKNVSVKEDEETEQIKMWIASTGVAQENGYKENEEEIDEQAKDAYKEVRKLEEENVKLRAITEAAKDTMWLGCPYCDKGKYDEHGVNCRLRIGLTDAGYGGDE